MICAYEPNAWRRLDRAPEAHVVTSLSRMATILDKGVSEYILVGSGRIFRKRFWKDHYTGSGEVWFEYNYPEKS